MPAMTFDTCSPLMMLIWDEKLGVIIRLVIRKGVSDLWPAVPKLKTHKMIKIAHIWDKTSRQIHYIRRHCCGQSTRRWRCSTEGGAVKGTDRHNIDQKTKTKKHVYLFREGWRPSLPGWRTWWRRSPRSFILPIILQLRRQTSIITKPRPPPPSSLRLSCVKKNRVFQLRFIPVFSPPSSPGSRSSRGWLRPPPPSHRPTVMEMWRRMRSGSIFPSARLLQLQRAPCSSSDLGERCCSSASSTSLEPPTNTVRWGERGRGSRGSGGRGGRGLCFHRGFIVSLNRSWSGCFVTIWRKLEALILINVLLMSVISVQEQHRILWV